MRHRPRIKRKGIGYPAPNYSANKRKQADPKRRSYAFELKGDKNGKNS